MTKPNEPFDKFNIQDLTLCKIMRFSQGKEFETDRNAITQYLRATVPILSTYTKCHKCSPAATCISLAPLANQHQLQFQLHLEDQPTNVRVYVAKPEL